MRKEILWALVITLVLALSGLAQALAQEKVIGVGVPAPYQPIFETPTVLVQKYLKEKEGITLKVVKHRGFVEIMASLLRGDALYGYFTVPVLVKALEQEAQVRAFSGFVQMDPLALVGPATIADLRQFKGKKISILSRGSGTDIAMRTVMASVGLEAGKDYDVIIIPGTPQRLSAIIAGSVDGGMIMLEEAIGVAAKTGGKFKVLKNAMEFTPRLSQFIWVAKIDTLNKQRDMIKLITRYYLQAYKEIYEMGPERLSKFAKDSWWGQAELQDLKLTYESFLREKLWPETADTGLNKDMWDTAISHNLKYGLLDKGFPYEKAVDRSVLEEVLKERVRR